MHPVLSLLQQWIDPADPLNMAVAIGRSPIAGKQAKHVFMTYGLADHFSPAATLAAFALAGRLEVVAHDASVSTPEAIGNLTEQATPFSGNFEVSPAASSRWGCANTVRLRVQTAISSHSMCPQRARMWRASSGWPHLGMSRRSVNSFAAAPSRRRRWNMRRGCSGHPCPGDGTVAGAFPSGCSFGTRRATTIPKTAPVPNMIKL